LKVDEIVDEIVDIIISKKPKNINQFRDGSESAFEYACKNKMIDVVKKMIELEDGYMNIKIDNLCEYGLYDVLYDTLKNYPYNSTFVNIKKLCRGYQIEYNEYIVGDKNVISQIILFVLNHVDENDLNAYNYIDKNYLFCKPFFTPFFTPLMSAHANLFSEQAINEMKKYKIFHNVDSN